MTALRGSTRRPRQAALLNPVPIEQVANRWISKYAARFTSALVGLQQHLETPVIPEGGLMAITAHVYQIHIAADADRVWEAITDSDWTEQYFHSTLRRTPTAGQPYRTVLVPAGSDAVDGTVEEMPPGSGTAGRFVVTWARAVRSPPWRPSRRGGGVDRRAGRRGLTWVRLVHGDLALSPLTWAHVKDGWVWIIDAGEDPARDRTGAARADRRHVGDA
ncbi:MAG: hypothetical protein R2734_02760 [Nocardioides sp.]